MNLIIPVSGKSSRFPGLRPKWLLTQPNGNLMISECLQGLNISKFNKIFIICLEEHEKQFNVQKCLVKVFDKLGLLSKINIILIEKSESQPETIYKGIKKADIKGPIFIKDSDNYFECDPEVGNFVCNINIEDVGNVNAGNKSYIFQDEKNVILNIVEKHVISNTFCTGGYGFKNSDEFCFYYEKIKFIPNIFVSHVIYQMLLDGQIFTGKSVKNFIDWGTLDDWNNYKNKFSTLFIDLDGVLFLNSGEYFTPTWGDTDQIPTNLKLIKKLYNSGKVQIVITTARTEEYREQTLNQLSKFDLKYHHIIFGLFHSKRIIINDYSLSNPYKTCDSINIERDSINLNHMLKSVLDFEDMTSDEE